MVGEGKRRPGLKRAPVPSVGDYSGLPPAPQGSESVADGGGDEAEVATDAGRRTGMPSLTGGGKQGLQRRVSVTGEDSKGWAPQESERGQEGRAIGEWRGRAGRPWGDGPGPTGIAAARPSSVFARAASQRRPVRLEPAVHGPADGQVLPEDGLETTGAKAGATLRAEASPRWQGRRPARAEGEAPWERGQLRLGGTDERREGFARDRRREWRRAKERAAAMLAAAEEQLRVDMARW